MPTTESRDEIDWPSEFQTDKVKVHVRNEIQINATPEQVWAHLIRALRWPGYYSNAHDVRLIDEPAPTWGRIRASTGRRSVSTWFPSP